MSASEYLVLELRRIRESLGLTQESWADRVHFSAKHVGSIERGERPALPDYLTSTDKAFGTSFMVFYRKFVVGEHTPVWFRPFSEHEGNATLIRAFQPLLIPGLLQTEAYAQAVLSAYRMPEDEAATALSTRMGRQAILWREKPCQLAAVIDESVLTRQAGSPETMREQLIALVEACQRPNIQVQVIPSEVGVYPGMEGPLVLANVDGRTVGFLDDHLDGRVVEAPDETAALEGTWETIRGYALPHHQSLDLITRTAEKWT
ncbi:helix-turn-helix domain-containing protein [Micromonospora sp. NBC_01813]|uniref:helix-turn-helix domain-containing protein n=1 Tax=Micromonospora sp. NBC_01813 TaxID=2975988 RepID=UPI002DDBB229|nr:helix-turn-helix transcriptional regulator [Micromonospora sp. NBC_01813]WSA07232.1 helix-turn-helix transcriptional regulator [Micromonospora sp. NBC_01813]